MGFDFTRNTLNVKYIYDAFTSEKFIIDNSYQRRRVWMPKDNVRLIETILLNLVIPEIFLWQAKVNPNNGEIITHIVDGQQRINAIIDYIAGEFYLKESYLLTNEIKEKYGNKYFSELPDLEKGDIWTYNLSVVNIDRKCTLEDIKTMFYRLNITDYSLTEQEKRNSLDNAFGLASLGLSEDEFWSDVKVFSSGDVKRMRDVEYCSNILILADEGIVDQTTSKKINQVYDDNKEVFEKQTELLILIERAMDLIRELINEDTTKFISKKIQLYTLFSICFDVIENNISLSDDIKERFTLFVKVYDLLFKNSLGLSSINEEYRKIFDMINKYRLASSEGVNKLSNRMTRFEVLKKICINGEKNTELQLTGLIEWLHS